MSGRRQDPVRFLVVVVVIVFVDVVPGEAVACYRYWDLNCGPVIRDEGFLVEEHGECRSHGVIVESRSLVVDRHNGVVFVGQAEDVRRR